MGRAHSENCNHAAIEWEEHYGRVSPFSSQTDDVKMKIVIIVSSYSLLVEHAVGVETRGLNASELTWITYFHWIFVLDVHILTN
jgi:hypothetical protein